MVHQTDVFLCLITLSGHPRSLATLKRVLGVTGPLHDIINWWCQELEGFSQVLPDDVVLDLLASSIVGHEIPHDKQWPCARGEPPFTVPRLLGAAALTNSIRPTTAASVFTFVPQMSGLRSAVGAESDSAKATWGDNSSLASAAASLAPTPHGQRSGLDAFRCPMHCWFSSRTGHRCNPDTPTTTLANWFRMFRSWQRVRVHRATPTLLRKPPAMGSCSVGDAGVDLTPGQCFLAQAQHRIGHVDGAAT